MFGILFDVLLVVLVLYAALGLRFVMQAAVAEKAMGRAPKPKELLLIGTCWLPLLISDPKDFNSVEVLQIRQQRREQKGYERRTHLARAQQQTITKQVEVERERAELEALRTKALAETDRHRQNAEEFINQRALKELSTPSKGDDEGEVVEAEIVFNHFDRNLPRRYLYRKQIDGEDVVYDESTKAWIPQWSMLPGYRWEPNA